MAFKMKGVSLFGDKGLRKAKRKAIKDEKSKMKSGEITRKEFKEAKKEIKKYIDY